MKSNTYTHCKEVLVCQQLGTKHSEKYYPVPITYLQLYRCSSTALLSSDTNQAFLLGHILAEQYSLLRVNYLQPRETLGRNSITLSCEYVTTLPVTQSNRKHQQIRIGACYALILRGQKNPTPSTVPEARLDDRAHKLMSRCQFVQHLFSTSI